MRLSLFALLLALLTPSPVSAQEVPTPHARRLVVPAAAGSALGLVAGVAMGVVMGSGGSGDDAGTIPALIIGSAGSVFGSAVGASLAGASFPHSLGGAALGLLPAAAVGAVATAASGSPTVLVVSFSLTQGIVTAMIGGAPPRRDPGGTVAAPRSPGTSSRSR